MSTTENTRPRPRVATGMPGLDELLRGGLPSQRIYLVQGGPGTGKTTLAFQFLLEGVARGESALYLSLLQTRDELHDIVGSHGWSLDGLTIVELPEDVQEIAESEQTVFSRAEVELDELIDATIQAIKAHKPRRVVLDSLSELRVLVDSDYQLRRHLIKLKHSLLEAGCTTLLTTGESVIDQHPTYQTIVHGSIALRHTTPSYGPVRRQIEIEKVRGIDFDGGLHDVIIQTGGLRVFSRLRPDDASPPWGERVESGNAALDALFGGGLELGGSCMVMGTSGAGKSTLTSLYAVAVAAQGGYVPVYCFDESKRTYVHRAKSLKLGMISHVESGRIDLRHYDVGQLTPGHLMQDLRRDVEEREAKLVIFDSLTGYLSLMPQAGDLTVKMHEILHFLSTRGVLTLVTLNVHGLLGQLTTEVDTSYLADTVVLMRHFEAGGTVRQCISVLKKRHGEHERTIREIAFEPGGLRVGPPLSEFSGVLTGTPRYEGKRESLLDRQGEAPGGEDDRDA